MYIIYTQLHIYLYTCIIYIMLHIYRHILYSLYKHILNIYYYNLIDLIQTILFLYQITQWVSFIKYIFPLHIDIRMYGKI